ncbi:heparan-alpha-glucosaminide N-acetyltransferase [Kineococcus rubinsiae]|uniref:heparan-alpha-glucosaminide N-acetyltransferase n=1 Tax=Kineococcus rubinsiae TaxID=2609562 RepID=UPI001430BD8B|nr:heparan-alpha-glucosaminide N-acetyltransferase [Kineococcus rubinsiae]NIZ90491.1 heparan-alpha-glucosaminide N-acetyltransferase [Kineococcus rubinsiae]
MTAVTTPVRTGRLTSLDVVRGLMLVVSVAVNSLLVTPGWFEHAEWTGVHGLDLVFPVFVTLTGCGLGFAMHRRTDVGGLARRVVVLVVVGLLYNALVLDRWDLATWRLPGVLQLYAAVVAVVALEHLLTRSWRGWALATVLLAVAHTTLLAVWAAGCAGGALTPDCNPSGALDVAVFGAPHVYAAGDLGHDPEGLVSVLGALVSAAAGATVGHLLLSVRDAGRGPRAAVLPVAGLAAGAAVLGWLAAVVPGLLTGTAVPAMKRLWSAPFSLPVAAGVAVVLLLVHLALDRPGTPAAARAATWPLVALGRNSLLVYFGSHVVTSLLLQDVDAGGASAAQRLAAAVSVGGHNQLSLTVLAVLAWTALAAVLHRSRIYLRP